VEKKKEEKRGVQCGQGKKGGVRPPRRIAGRDGPKRCLWREKGKGKGRAAFTGAKKGLCQVPSLDERRQEPKKKKGKKPTGTRNLNAGEKGSCLPMAV